MAQNVRFLTVSLAGLLTLAPAVPARGEAIRLNDGDALKAVASRVDPVYPPIARQTKVAGTVRLDVFIDEAGKVEKAEVLTGNPMLTGAALEAVKKWRFKPQTANGNPAKAVASVSFNFKL